MEREKLKSRLGFILLSAGCAIGIGNVWKFPYMAGQGGGGAFVLFYLLFLVIPVSYTHLDFQSCALDQLSHLSTSSVFTASGRGPQRSTIIPERRSFVKLFFKKVCIFSKMTKQRMRWSRERRKSS